MSGLKNSPFARRLRSSRTDGDDVLPSIGNGIIGVGVGGASSSRSGGGVESRTRLGSVDGGTPGSLMTPKATIGSGNGNGNAVASTSKQHLNNASTSSSATASSSRSYSHSHTRSNSGSNLGRGTGSGSNPFTSRLENEREGSATRGVGLEEGGSRDAEGDVDADGLTRIGHVKSGSMSRFSSTSSYVSSNAASASTSNLPSTSASTYLTPTFTSTSTPNLVSSVTTTPRGDGDVEDGDGDGSERFSSSATRVGEESPRRGKMSVSYGFGGVMSPKRSTFTGSGAFGGGGGAFGAGGGAGGFGGSAGASIFESPKRNKGKGYGDRFVPSKEVVGDLRTAYHLMDDGGGLGGTLSKGRVIPSESDALKEEANSLFNSILHTEVNPPHSPRRAVSPSRPGNVIGGPSLPPSTPNRRRIFDFGTPSRKDPATPSRRLDLPTDEAYSMSPIRKESRHLLESPRNSLRNVPKTPYRVLDAPELADDFYLNLVDWSSTNVLGVGLGSCVYLWTAHNAVVSKLCDLSAGRDTVSSVSWVQRGTTLAVGTLGGKMHIYDAASLKLMRTYQQAHVQRIGALAWNGHVLSSGSRDRTIHHRDVREGGMRPFKRCVGHRQEVCGLKWSAEGGGVGGASLASGGNDNKVCIWDLRGSRRAAASASAGGGGGGTGDDMPGDLPLWKFHEHTAAVKALAWDPHLSGVLATGGGTQDKHIRFWNVANGQMLSQLDTGSQVCNLIWSLTSHELVSTHGFSNTTAQNQICIWKYPTLNMVASLTGHSNRVLYLAMSPDGETIVTGAGDETLRFWNAFPRRERREAGEESRLDYGKLIR